MKPECSFKTTRHSGNSDKGSVVFCLKMLAWQKQGNNWRNSSSGVSDAMATLTIIFGKHLPSSGGDLQLMAPLYVTMMRRSEPVLVEKCVCCTPLKSKTSIWCPNLMIVAPPKKAVLFYKSHNSILHYSPPLPKFGVWVQLIFVSQIFNEFKNETYNTSAYITVLKWRLFFFLIVAEIS